MDVSITHSYVVLVKRIHKKKLVSVNLYIWFNFIDILHHVIATLRMFQ